MAKALKIFFIFFYAALLSITFFQKTERTDLEIVQLAAKRMLSGESFYRLDDNQEHTKPPLGTLLFLPTAFVSTSTLKIIWDSLLTLSTVLLFWILLKKISWKSDLNISTIALLGFALTFNNWNSELRCGQFNVLFFVGILLGVLFSSFSAGSVYALALLVKPTFLVFTPWVLSNVSNKRKFFVGGIGTVLLVTGLYVFLFGYDKLVQDHLLFLQTAPLSSEKHIERTDNHGLPSLLSSWNKHAYVSSVLQLFSLVLSTLIVFLEKDKWRSLALIAFVGAFLSPMAWVQNYTLALPLILFALDDFFSEENKTQKTLGGLCLVCFFVAFQIFNPTTLKTSFGSLVWKYRWVDYLTLSSLLFYVLIRIGFLRKRLS